MDDFFEFCGAMLCLCGAALYLGFWVCVVVAVVKLALR